MSAPEKKILAPDDYTVGWICAIKPEYVAARLFLDELHAPLSCTPHGDNNVYTLGRIHDHNVAIASLPDGAYGTDTAAVVASHLLRTFTNIRIGLMVGIGGGAPTPENDIRLGDIVVSSPRDGNSGVFEYDFGKTIQEKGFQLTRHLDQPPHFIRAAVSSLQVEHDVEGNDFRQDIEIRTKKNKRLRKYQRPDPETDILYRSDFAHPDGAGGCKITCGSDPDKIVQRERRDDDEDDDPAIHYGLIASANTLMKDAGIRDRLAAEKGVLCFEMEAAGLMNHFPCLVIRGICDYSDSHKNKDWQEYAAMTAAAYAAALLRLVPQSKVKEERRITDMVASVHENVRELCDNVTAHHQDHQIDRWLRAVDPSVNHNTAKERRHEGTGTWFLLDQRFKTWKDESGSFLWLSGIAGCGKTVLSSTIIDDLLNTDSAAHLAYFYFDFNDNRKQTLENLLRSLLHQLYGITEDTKSCVRALWESCTKQQPTNAQMYECLIQVIGKVGQSFFVIDAVDESTTRQGTFCTGTLSFIQRLRQDTTKTARILVTSRAEGDIQASFSTWIQGTEIIALKHTLVQQDIESYIHHELRNGGRFDRWEKRRDLLDLVQSSLMAKANGMFRWAACQLDSLEKCLDPRSLKNALDSLPRGLDETYRRMIENIPEENMDNAITILRFLAYSERPLEVDELVDALAVDTGTCPGFDPENRMPNPRDISLYCPSLVTVQSIPQYLSSYFQSLHPQPGLTSYVEEVRLAHFSVQEFLTSDRLEGKLRMLMDRSRAKEALATICVVYLSQINNTIWPQDSRSKKDLIADTYPFAWYSAWHWRNHAAARPPARDTKIEHLILDFFLHNESAYANWNTLIYGGDITEGNCIYRASESGMTLDIEALLEHSVDVNAESTGYYCYALIAAAENGHTELVKLLLDRGAMVDSQSKRRETALHQAAAGGHEDVIEVLIKAKADVNALDETYVTVVGAACQSGNAKVVRRLIEEWDADIHLPLGLNPLGIACDQGDAETIDLLLSKGANINKLGPDSWSPLSLAARGADLRTASALIQLGANPNPNRNEYLSPVEAASHSGNESILRILLLNGASPNRNAISVASRKGHHNVVRMLLDAITDDCLANNYSCRDAMFADALVDAAYEGFADITKTLLEAGANANSFNSIGRGALTGAFFTKNYDMAKILLNRGASIYALAHNPKYCGVLEIICRVGDATAVNMLLDRGLDLSLGLPVACWHRNLAVTQLLIHSGVDVNVPNSPYGTSLAAASYGGSLQVVQLLLQAQADVNATCSTHGSALIAASSQGHGHVVQELLARGANPNITVSCTYVPNRNGSELYSAVRLRRARYRNALQAACYNGHQDAANLLLEAGVKVDDGALKTACGREDDSIFRLLLGRGITLTPKEWEMCLSAAIDSDNDEVIRTTLDRCPDLSGPRGVGPLHAAASRNSAKLVCELLDRGADLKAPGPRFNDALIAASYGGCLEVVRVLLHAGADPARHYIEPDEGDETPRWKIHYCSALHAAVLRRHVEVTEFLLEHGADATISTGRHGNLFLAAVADPSEDEDDTEAEDTEEADDFSLCSGDEPETRYGSKIKDDEGTVMTIVQTLFKEGGAVGWSEADYDDFLVHSSSRGYADIVDLLIERKKAERDAHDTTRQNSAAEAAFANGHITIVWTLLQHGATIDWDCRHKKSKKTLLHYAAKHGRESIVQQCISAGVNVNLPDVKGGTALHLAALHGHSSIVRVLLDNGGEPSTRMVDGFGYLPLEHARRFRRDQCILALTREGEKPVD